MGGGIAPITADLVMNQLYPGKTVAELNEEQKQTVAALTTLTGTLAGGLSTGNSAGAVTGGHASQNEVENNSLAIPTPPPPLPGLQAPAVNTGLDGKPNLSEQIAKEIKESFSGLGKAITNPGEFGAWVLEGFGIAKPIDPNSYAKPLKTGDQLPYTPTTDPDKFNRIGSGARIAPDGSIWEKDTSSHGGDQWKRWPDKKSWERKDKPNSIWSEDGRVRK